MLCLHLLSQGSYHRGLSVSLEIGRPGAFKVAITFFPLLSYCLEDTNDYLFSLEFKWAKLEAVLLTLLLYGKYSISILFCLGAFLLNLCVGHISILRKGKGSGNYTTNLSASLAYEDVIIWVLLHVSLPVNGFPLLHFTTCHLAGSAFPVTLGSKSLNIFSHSCYLDCYGCL